jgi:peptide/nickel transport system ATP-binding protein
MSAPLLEIDGLRVDFTTRRGVVRAVRGVSLTVAPGETLGIVGESGSGKSVTAQAAMGLVAAPGAIASGDIRWKGRSLLDPGARGFARGVRGREMAMVFQDAMTSLDPLFTCGQQIGEVLRAHLGYDRAAARARARALLELVGIAAPERRLDQYPFELSGGMRQRVMIAMALACEPELLIADEPTTALDVTIQAQILELLNRLQKEMGMAILLITHDLGVVAETCNRVAVMYAGQIVEYAHVEEIFAQPRMPYTAGLLGSIPKLGETHERLRVIPGNVPNPSEFPAGCKFHPRCPVAIDRCTVENPPLEEIRPAHWTRCWRAGEVESGTLDLARAFEEVPR